MRDFRGVILLPFGEISEILNLVSYGTVSTTAPSSFGSLTVNNPVVQKTLGDIYFSVLERSLEFTSDDELLRYVAEKVGESVVTLNSKFVGNDFCDETPSRRGDLFYLTCPQNWCLKKEISSVLDTTTFATLWIGGHCDYGDFSWDDSTVLSNLVNNSGKHVFMGSQAYQIFVEMIVDAITNKSVVESIRAWGSIGKCKIRDVLNGCRYKGSVDRYKLIRYFYSSLDVVWMDSFVLVVDQFVFSSTTILYRNLYCNCQTFGFRFSGMYLRSRNDTLINIVDLERERDFLLTGVDHYSGHFLNMQILNLVNCRSSGKPEFFVFYDVRRWIYLWAANFSVYGDPAALSSADFLPSDAISVLTSANFASMYKASDVEPERRYSSKLWHTLEHVLTSRKLIKSTLTLARVREAGYPASGLQLCSVALTQRARH